MTENSNRLPVLVAEIRRAHADVQDAANTAAERAISAGHALLEAKELVPHGEWLPWLREHCALNERTAQLYMKVARSGAKSATVAVLGLNAAAKAVELVYGDFFYDPFGSGTDERMREWWLFSLYLTQHCNMHPAGVSDHIYWIARKDFTSPDNWLTDGPAWTKNWGGQMGDHMPAWRKFQQEHNGTSVEDIVKILQKLIEEAPEPKGRPLKRKRRRKAA